ILDLAERAHREAELSPLYRAALCGCVGALDRGANFLGRDSQRARVYRIDVDTDLVLGIADDRDTGDSCELLETSLVHVERGARDGAQVTGTGEAEHRDRALARVGGEQRGAIGTVGQR